MSTKLSLLETAKAVSDSKSLLEFVRMLIADRKDEASKEMIRPSSPYGPGANGWENWTIESYLEAAASWAETTEFGDSQGATPNPWQKFALFLCAGKIYE
jgi:hypothetical protein